MVTMVFWMGSKRRSRSRRTTIDVSSLLSVQLLLPPRFAPRGELPRVPVESDVFSLRAGIGMGTVLRAPLTGKAGGREKKHRSKLLFLKRGTP